MEENEGVRQLVHALNGALGLSQEEIAKQVGVSYTTVNAWANGRRQPRQKNKERLEQLLLRLTRTASTALERLRKVTALLEAEYGSPRLGNLDDPLDELFFIMLSLKTSHRTYEDIFEALKDRFHPWQKLLDVSVEEVEQTIRKGGLGSIKARAFVRIAHKLNDDFGAVTLDPLAELATPRAEEYLQNLPGVGKKTARCVLMYSLGRDILPVDTHTYRVGVRLGVLPSSESPDEAHGSFEELVPDGLAYSVHTNFVAHGRETCKDPTPDCESCVASHLCEYYATSVDAEAEANSRDGPGAPAILSSRPASEPIAVDIYAGSGGLSAGIEDAGYEVAYALDWDAHACDTYQRNMPNTTVAKEDVRDIRGVEIRDIAGSEVLLVAGGPNCQGVSERGLRDPDDPRNFMFPEFVRLVGEIQPDAVMMENVPGLTHRHNYELLQTIFQSFEDLGYNTAAEVLLAADYGAPQLRYRFFLIGTPPGVEPTFPPPTHSSGENRSLFSRPYVTAWEAIGDLPDVGPSRQEDEPLEYPGPPSNDYQEYARGNSSCVRNHVCSATSDVNLERISHIPPGGNWKDIPGDLLPPRFFRCRMTDHSTTYARLRKDQPSFTITAQFGNVTVGAFTHPERDRALTVREGARLQTFKDDFVFEGPRNSQYRQVGNAVPPLLSRAVAEHLRKLVSGERAAGVKPSITRELLDHKGGWDAFPVMTPRFSPLFGQGTQWPEGWGEQPADPEEKLDDNYRLREEFRPDRAMTG